MVGTIPEDRSINTTIQSSNAVPEHIGIFLEPKVRAVGTIPEDRSTTRVRMQYLSISQYFRNPRYGRKERFPRTVPLSEFECSTCTYRNTSGTQGIVWQERRLRTVPPPEFECRTWTYRNTSGAQGTGGKNDS